MAKQSQRQAKQLAPESAIIVRRRKKIGAHLEKIDREITDQSLTRVKMAILRSLERNASFRTRLKSKQIHLSTSLQLSSEVKQLIDKIAKTKLI